MCIQALMHACVAAIRHNDRPTKTEDDDDDNENACRPMNLLLRILNYYFLSVHFGFGVFCVVPIWSDHFGDTQQQQNENKYIKKKTNQMPRHFPNYIINIECWLFGCLLHACMLHWRIIRETKTIECQWRWAAVWVTEWHQTNRRRCMRTMANRASFETKRWLCILFVRCTHISVWDGNVCGAITRRF